MHPPTHWLAAAYVKYKPPTAARAPAEGAEPQRAHTIAGLKAMFPGGVMKG